MQTLAAFPFHLRYTRARVNLIGTHFDGFVVLREVARGAHSRVFLVSDGKAVKALKVFPPEAAHHAERELSYGGSRHPHLNPVEALVSVSGYPGVLMPFVAGDRLGLWLDEVPTPVFLRTFEGILLGLEHLHAQDIIHRDVKPENIIVSKGARARLLDFDLAVRVDEVQRRSAVAGTVAYLSPEQAAGRPATKASDLYAAGIILYRAVTGEVPFTGSVSEVLEAHRRQVPDAPSSFHEALRPFDPFFTTLLAKCEEDRFASAEAVVEALKPLRRGLEVSQ